MTDDTSDDDDYEVGYGRPPKQTQWKPGQSGNPSGKTKKAESIEATLKKLAAKEIVVHDQGVPVTMTQQEAMCSTIYLKAMKGDIQSAKLITSYLASAEKGQLPPMPYELSPADLAAIETYADWVWVKEQAASELQSQTKSDSMDGEDGDVDFASDG